MNATQLSGRKRTSVTCEAASRSFSDACSTCGSGFCRFPSKRETLLPAVWIVVCIIIVAIRFVNCDLCFFFVVVVCWRWAHIGCAVAMPEVFFVNVNLREGINTDQITSARRKLVSSSLFNLLGNINDCFFNCVTPCSLQQSFFCHALLVLCFGLI